MQSTATANQRAMKILTLMQNVSIFVDLRSLRMWRWFYAAEAEVVSACRSLAFAASSDHISRAILIRAEVGSAAHDSLDYASFRRVERVVGAGWVAGYSA
jgi:hypothetical protein